MNSNKTYVGFGIEYSYLFDKPQQDIILINVYMYINSHSL